MRHLLFVVLLCILSGCVLPQSAMEGDKLLAAGDSLKAIQQYEQALQEVTDTNAKNTILKKQEQAKELYAQSQLIEVEKILGANQGGQLASINTALILLNQSVRYDPSSGVLTAKQQQLEAQRNTLEAAGAGAKKDVLTAIAAYDFKKAENLVAQVLAVSPADAEAKNLQGKIREMSATYNSLENKIQEGKLEDAVAVYGKLRTLSPTPLDPQQLPLRDKAVALLQEQLATLKNNNQWFDALNLLSLWSSPEMDKELSIVRQQGGQYYVQLAKAALQKNNPHHAFLLLERAMRLDEKNLEIFTLHKESQDQVEKALMRYIAVGSFDSPSTDPDAGKQFSDALISHLYNNLPYGINILEREKIDVALKEQQVSKDKLGEMLGVEMVITGTVSLFKVDQMVDRRKASVKVQTNQETIENPAYQAMQRQFGPDEKLWPNVPPAMITKQQSEMISYEKGTGTLKGFAKVSVRIFDTEKGAISFVKDLEASVNEQSEFQDEVLEAGIPSISMKLPTETEAKEMMRKQIVDEIGKIIQASFESREKRFLNHARFYLERREMEQALVPLAEGLLYSRRDNISENNPDIKETLRLIDEILE